MKHIKLLTTNFLTLEYNAIDEYISADWTGEMTNEAVIQTYENILFFLQREHCHKLLDNHYKVQGLWVELTDWLAYDWHPRAKEAGLQYHAAVYSQNIFSRLSTTQAIKMIKSETVKGFDTIQDAEEWLKSF